MARKFGWRSGTLTCQDIKVLGDVTIQDDLIFSDVSAGVLGVTGGIDMTGTTQAIGINLVGGTFSTASIGIGDDDNLNFGAGNDISFEYDEDGTNDFRATTASGQGTGYIFTGGTGTSTGSGGVFTILAGAGGSTSGAGGAVSLTAGAATAGDSAGGASSLTGGAGQGTSAGGATTLTSGASENGSGVNPGASGAITLTVGTPGTATTGTAGAGGTLDVLGVAGGASTGSSSTAGAGSTVNVTAGAGGASSGGSDTGGVGGDVIVTAGAGGTGATAGQDGQIIMRNGTGLPTLHEQIAPTTATGTATLTDLQMLGGILEATPAATATYTTRTGTQIEAALSGGHTTNDSFDLTIINLGGAGDIITLAGGTDVTIVGSTTVDDSGADITSSGTFRFRKSAANTFIAYRIA